MPPEAQGVEQQVAQERAIVQEIANHLQGLEAAINTLQNISVPDRAELLADVVRLLERRYGAFVVRLGSGENGEAREQALRELEESADGDYY